MPKGGHGKGNWGDLRDEMAPQLTSTADASPTTEKLGLVEGTTLEEFYMDKQRSEPMKSLGDMGKHRSATVNPESDLLGFYTEKEGQPKD